MAIFVTLFVASEVELDVLFPGWSCAVGEPRFEQVDDADTGEGKLVRLWTPGPARELRSHAVTPELEVPRPPILPPDSDYERHMEERAPARFKVMPHACVKNLGAEHLDAIASELVGRQVVGRPARVTPDGFAVEALDDEAVGVLSATRETDLAGLAVRWVGRARGFDGGADALWVLRRLRALSLCCAGEALRRLCLWAES